MSSNLGLPRHENRVPRQHRKSSLALARVTSTHFVLLREKLTTIVASPRLFSLTHLVRGLPDRDLIVTIAPEPFQRAFMSRSNRIRQAVSPKLRSGV